MKDREHSSGLRPFLFIGISGAVFALLLFRLIGLQIVHGIEYRDRSDNNRFRLIEVTAPRGVIRDRSGEILVTNIAAYSCYGVPNELWRDERSTDILQAIFEYSDLNLRQDLLRPMRGSFQPVRLVRDLSFRKLSEFEEQRDLIPGAFLEIEPKRVHPDKICAHLVGYVGEVSEKELESFSALRQGDLVGKRGLERLYDQQLRGRKGQRFSVVNVHGQEVRAAEQFEEIQPVSGNELWLTIDRGAQMLAESLLVDKTGAIVVMDVVTGGVVVMASAPAYDPDVFSGSISAEDWNALLNDPGKPMLNRAIQTMYPPGSSIKMAMLIEGLMSGEITPDFTTFCPGYHTVGNRTFKCWKKGGHGTVGCVRAIEASCDVFFYKLGLKIGVDGVHRALDRFHFGRATGVDQTSEASGLAPSSEYYDNRYGKSGWTKGFIPSIAIGQGEVLVTPLQMCAFATALADGKVWKQPYLVDRIVNPTSSTVMKPEQPLTEELGVPPEIMSIVHTGMRNVVWGDFGTARAQRNPEVPIAGKTGTAQNPHGDDHAWFIGFAPESAPQYAACALVEFGEHGSSAAAPIVRQMLEYLLAPPDVSTDQVASLHEAH